MRVRRISPEPGKLKKVLRTLNNEGKRSYVINCSITMPLSVDWDRRAVKDARPDVIVVDGLDVISSHLREEVMFRVMQLAATFDKHPDIFVLI